MIENSHCISRRALLIPIIRSGGSCASSSSISQPTSPSATPRNSIRWATRRVRTVRFRAVPRDLPGWSVVKVRFFKRGPEVQPLPAKREADHAEAIRLATALLKLFRDDDHRGWTTDRRHVSRVCRQRYPGLDVPPGCLLPRRGRRPCPDLDLPCPTPPAPPRLPVPWWGTMQSSRLTYPGVPAPGAAGCGGWPWPVPPGARASPP